MVFLLFSSQKLVPRQHIRSMPALVLDQTRLSTRWKLHQHGTGFVDHIVGTIGRSQHFGLAHVCRHLWRHDLAPARRARAAHHGDAVPRDQQRHDGHDHDGHQAHTTGVHLPGAPANGQSQRFGRAVRIDWVLFVHRGARAGSASSAGVAHDLLGAHREESIHTDQAHGARSGHSVRNGLLVCNHAGESIEF